MLIYNSVSQSYRPYIHPVNQVRNDIKNKRLKLASLRVTARKQQMHHLFAVLEPWIDLSPLLLVVNWSVLALMLAVLLLKYNRYSFKYPSLPVQKIFTSLPVGMWRVAISVSVCLFVCLFVCSHIKHDVPQICVVQFLVRYCSFAFDLFTSQAIKVQSFGVKIHQKNLLAARLRWNPLGDITALPDPLAGFRGKGGRRWEKGGNGRHWRWGCPHGDF